MRLIIAEKPSVARDLARVLGLGGKGDGFLQGDGVTVTWCIGHLLEFEDPAHYDPAWKRWALDTLPMVPSHFALRVREGVEDQAKVVRKLLRDKALREVINACDAGREGELIFRQIYEFSECTRPVQRLWVSSLTDEAVRLGFSRLRPGLEFDALADAARSRSESDWLVGLNATRALTCRTRDAGGDALWSVGRVQTPTLAMIVARDHEIAAFVPESYWRVEAKLSAGGGVWKATFIRTTTAPKDEEEREGQDAPKVERLATEQDARWIADAVRGRAGVVTRATRKTRRELPPLLYDLTSLQRRANQRYGLSAQRTLEVAQGLYERHKLITYPRTDARYLTSDQVGELPGILRAVGTLAPYRATAEALSERPLRISARIVDDAEVGDHHAILPTARSAEGARLDPDEKRVYDLIARRLLAALSPDAVIDTAEILVEVAPPPDAPLPADAPPPLTFRAKGRVLREPGWQAIDPPASSSDLDLPHIEEGAVVHVDDAATTPGQTRPPRPHDDASILRAMETAGRALDDDNLRRALRNAGLGTPATRAAILQTLLDRKYILRDGRALQATPMGCALIEALPVEALKSAELTGRWEKRLADIAEGRERRDAFMSDVVIYTGTIVDAIRGSGALPMAATERTRPEAEAIGACPACGAPVRKRGDVWTCDTGRTCPFVVFGTMGGKTIGVTIVRTLLKEKRTAVMTGFKSRAGKAFDAGLEVGPDGRVQLYFSNEPAAPKAEPSEPKPIAEGRAKAGPKASGESKPRAKAEGKAPASKAAPKPGADKSATKPRPSAMPAAPKVGDPCPTCGEGRVMRGRTSLGCSRWREGCGWRGPI